MEQYIKKSALVAEIERIKEMYCYDTKTNASFVAEAVINSINNAINTLEVKEVDLEKEIKEVQRKYKTIEENEGYPCTMYAGDIEWIAKYFFELGIKSKKGE